MARRGEEPCGLRPYGAVVLLLLLIFILENSQSVSIGYFGAHGHLPLGVALLLTAVLGVLLVVIPGTALIIQLRITARRHRRLDTERPASPAATPPAGPQPPAGSPPIRPAPPACKAKTRPPGRRTDSARTPAARRFRLDLPPARGGALIMVFVPVRPDVEVFERPPPMVIRQRREAASPPADPGA